MAATTDVAAAASSGSTVLASRLAASYHSRQRCLGADVPTEHPDGADQQSAQLADEIAVAVGRFAELVERGQHERAHLGLERGGRLVVDDPSETAQRDHDRLPDGVVALERNPSRKRSSSTADSRPPSVDDHASSTRLYRSSVVIEASTSPTKRSRSSSE